MGRIHKADRTPIKVVLVDCKIKPVVKWLNGFRNVFTESSCEGDEKILPYVAFYCSSQMELMQIASATIPFFANLEVYCEAEQKICYILRFHNTGNRDRYIKKLLFPTADYGEHGGKGKS